MVLSLFDTDAQDSIDHNDAATLGLKKLSVNTVTQEK